MLSKAPTPELQDIDGRSLSYQLRHAPSHRRAAWAKGLVTGKTRIDRFTRTHAAAICGVSLPIVSQAVKSDHSRLEPEAILAWWQSASFPERVALIHSFGPGPTWDALAAVID